MIRFVPLPVASDSLSLSLSLSFSLSLFRFLSLALFLWLPPCVLHPVFHFAATEKKQRDGSNPIWIRALIKASAAALMESTPAQKAKRQAKQAIAAVVHSILCFVARFNVLWL